MQRKGRSRDVYDVVNISRNFRDIINPVKAKEIAEKKFLFKGLSSPSLGYIMEAIDEGVLRANWLQELSHQTTVLDTAEAYLNELRDSLGWWMRSETVR